MATLNGKKGSPKIRSISPMPALYLSPSLYTYKGYSSPKAGRGLSESLGSEVDDLGAGALSGE